MKIRTLSGAQGLYFLRMLGGHSSHNADQLLATTGQTTTRHINRIYLQLTKQIFMGYWTISQVSYPNNGAPTTAFLS